MKIELCNNKIVEIPDHLLKFTSEGSSLADNCSWAADFLKKNKPPQFSNLRGIESMRKLSMLTLTRGLRSQYKSYMEPFGGAGIHAKLLESDESQTYVNDIDPDCVEILKLNFPRGHVSCVDLMSPENRSTLLDHKPDFLFVDSNNFTLNSMHKDLSEPNLYRDLTLDGFKSAQKYLVINDCSCFYLKYGAKSFKKYSELLEIDIHSLDEYYRALPQYWARKFPHWHLTRIMHFGVSSHQLFQKEPEPLEVMYLKAEDLKNNPVIKSIVYQETPDTLNLFGEVQ